ncbi:hypothetical protein NEA10_16845 [Phormidium yuhuli AB48]|uniref:Uncharacterized protein n=1 Tax=Phormidium yuhuli AB48 TaxID=2940671 RepID=A0ABY5ANA2_9CYAN|nr:hypothetical protein [Phormidium yuhuli]USR90485.1 hypothetical protein NEA10_16845 [Phormidium yuhuli AB48]
MRELLILVALFSFIWTFQTPSLRRYSGFSKDEQMILDQLLNSPEEVINDSYKIQKILKILSKGSKRDVSKFYHSIRYKVFDWSKEFGKPQIAPIFEDIAGLYYQKALPNENPIKVIEQIHRDFDFLCKS